MMKDKKYHVLAGLLVAALVGLPCYLESINLFAGLWGCLSGVIAGGVKEYTDNKHDGGRWDWKDFGFTCIGAVLAMVVVLCLHYGRG